MRVSLKTLIDRSVDNMGEVHPAVKDKAVQIIQKAYDEGINVQISSGFRSFEDQAYLFGKGRTTYEYNGKDYGKPHMSVVSNAEPGQSVHNYGLAIDYFLTTWDGSTATWNVDGDWRRVADIGKSMGFSWGGDWSPWKDYPHLELTGGLSWYELQQGKRPTHLLKGYLQSGSSGPDVKKLQERLIKLGYELGGYGTDGEYGKATESAVKQFQKDYGLAVDGVYGPNMEEKIYTIEVEELDMDQVPNWPEWKWNALGERYEDAQKQGKIKDLKWSENAYKQELTYDEILFISALI